MSDRRLFLWTALAAALVALMVYAGDPAPSYDVETDQGLIKAAVSGEAPPHEVARTPGALFLMTPWLVVGDGALLAIVIVDIVCLGLIAVGLARFIRPTFWTCVALVVVLAAGFPFRQLLFYGGVFMPWAAALVWGWVWTERRPVLAGVLWGVAGVARLWPMLLLFAVRDRRIRYGMVGTFAGLTGLGLLLPGVTVGSSVASLVAGGGRFVGFYLNGSLASWFTGFGTLPATLIGATLVLSVWVWGLQRVDDKVAWTIPAAILASPLAWASYLFAAAPALLRRPPVAAVAGAAFLVAPVIPVQALTTSVCLLAMYAAWTGRTVSRCRRAPTPTRT